MNRTNILLFVCLLPCLASGQVTISVTGVPQLTPLFGELYAAGTFNDWDPEDPAHALQPTGNGTFEVTIEAPAGSLVEFKITRGSWATVEGSSMGSYIPNRSFTSSGEGTVDIEVEGWEDLPGNHTVEENVFLVDDAFPLPQLGRERRIWIRLPAGYADTDDHYPVLYMHDGQNIFDAATSFVGEWEVDEGMNEGVANWCTDAIIVGIDNGGAHRLDEYAPWINAEYNEGGQGDLYAQDIIQAVKPFIDTHFRTLPDRLHTGTAGSSLGGLISLYMLMQYPEVFSKAGVFSPAIWFNEAELFALAQDHTVLPGARVYLIAGDAESSSMVPLMTDMHSALQEEGYGAGELSLTVVAGGQHSESSWAMQFPGAFGWMYDCQGSVAGAPEAAPAFRIYPNPVTDTVHVEASPSCTIARIQLQDPTGRLVRDFVVPGSDGCTIPLPGTATGFYRLIVHCHDGSIHLHELYRQ